MSGFHVFGTIAYLAAHDRPRVTERVLARLARIGLGDRLACVPARNTPGNPQIGALLTRRDILAAAEPGKPALILTGDLLPLDRAGEVLRAAAPDLARNSWSVCHLGGWWPLVPEPEPGSRHLHRAREVRSIHAVAYSPGTIAQLLGSWPGTVTAAADWLLRHGAPERQLGRMPAAVLLQPAVTTLPELLPFEPVALQPRYLA